MGHHLRYLMLVALTGLLAVFLHLSLFVYQLGAPVKAEYWLRELKIVKRVIAANIKGPKLVVLGGSNALVGIDSTMLEETVGIPTVNLALHGALNIHYLLLDAREVLRPYDYLLLALEYEAYTRDPNTLWFTNQVMTWDTTYFWDLPLKDKGTFIHAVPLNRLMAGAVAQLQRGRTANVLHRTVANDDDVLRRYAQAFTDTSTGSREVYSVENVDAHGDLRRLPQSRSYREDSDYGLSTPFVAPAHVWDELREFSEYCQARHITLFFAWPPSIKSPMLDAPAVINHVQQHQAYMRQHRMQMLGLPWEFSYERTFFSDTGYHLTPAGRSKHTEALLRYLRPLMLAPS
ncbi:protein of unknown function [Nitrospira japonica]|uniref:SGNH/GDSL hydrolase family protein n=2 Tax=Nitrospira japonica TaxID=1325564 RepID=A0A1W1I623_9BACT|nr:protein of unknown function [Nitrospira japonica]